MYRHSNLDRFRQLEQVVAARTVRFNKWDRRSRAAMVPDLLGFVTVILACVVGLVASDTQSLVHYAAFAVLGVVGLVGPNWYRWIALHMRERALEERAEAKAALLDHWASVRIR